MQAQSISLVAQQYGELSIDPNGTPPTIPEGAIQMTVTPCGESLAVKLDKRTDNVNAATTQLGQGTSESMTVFIDTAASGNMGAEDSARAQSGEPECMLRHCQGIAWYFDSEHKVCGQVSSLGRP